AFGEGSSELDAAADRVRFDSIALGVLHRHGAADAADVDAPCRDLAQCHAAADALHFDGAVGLRVDDLDIAGDRLCCGNPAAICDSNRTADRVGRHVALDVRHANGPGDRVDRQTCSGRSADGVVDRDVDVAAVVTPHLVALRIDGAHFSATGALGDGHVHEAE